MEKNFVALLLLAGLAVTGSPSLSTFEPDVVRLGNLKFAHYGAVSYMKELAPKYHLRIEERMFANGVDIASAIIACEIDIAASAADGAIAGARSKAEGRGSKVEGQPAEATDRGSKARALAAVSSREIPAFGARLSTFDILPFAVTFGRSWIPRPIASSSRLALASSRKKVAPGSMSGSSSG